jgi:mono/diheme cytochrome c family protein
MRNLAIALIVVAVAALAFGFWRWDLSDSLDPETVSLGAKVYAAHCAACHGARLEGQPNWQRPGPDGVLPAPPHDATGHTWHHPDRVLLSIVRDGGAAAAPPGFKSGMPAFGAVIQDKEIRAVIAYIKSAWPPDIRARQHSTNTGG